ncbi:MAG: molybdopterin-dependent oxidoreductase, partial [Thermoplasmata archaeon]
IIMVFLACPKDCFDSCSIIAKSGQNVTIKGNPEHPITSGFLCYKSKFFVDAELGGKRLKKALLRKGERGKGEFEEIDLEKAIEIVSKKMKETIEKYGASSILPVEYAGNRGLISYYFPRRFFNFIGSSKLNHSLCDEAGSKALKSLFGTSVGMDPENLKDMRMIIYWGMNPAWTNVHGWKLAKVSKAKIYVIDPLITESARGANEHIRIKPGTDIFLIYLILNRMKELGLNIGIMDEVVKKYKSDDLEKIVGVNKNVINNFVSDLIQLKPFSIQMGYGFQRNINGGLTIKLIGYLLYLFGQEKNFIYDAKHIIDYEYLEGKGKDTQIINFANLGRELLEKNIKFLFIYNTNPLISLPNQNLLRNVLIKKDLFIVVHDLFLTDTALYADVIIPATSFFETRDLVDSYYHDYINLNEGLLKPIGESISNHDLFVKLAEKMDLKEPSLYESVDSIIDKIIKQSSIKREDLFNKGFAKIQRINNKINIRLDGFLDEIRNFKIPEMEGYFRLLSPTSIQGVSGQHNNYYDYDTYVHVSIEDMKKLELREGDRVKIYNEFGEIYTNVKGDNSVGNGILVIYKGSWPSIYGWNVNFLTSDQIQEYAMCTTLNSTFVKMEKV